MGVLQDIRMNGQMKTFDEVDFAGIVMKFQSSLKSKFNLPRIAFIGNFRHLSMTDQRQISKHIGFEFYEEIPFGTTDQGDMQQLTGKWSDITKEFTKIVVIGNCYQSMDESRFKSLLCKTYKKSTIPIIIEEKIPVMMEDQLWKIHLNYPHISNSTMFESDYLRKITLK